MNNRIKKEIEQRKKMYWSVLNAEPKMAWLSYPSFLDAIIVVRDVKSWKDSEPKGLIDRNDIMMQAAAAKELAKVNNFSADQCAAVAAALLAKIGPQNDKLKKLRKDAKSATDNCLIVKQIGIERDERLARACDIAQMAGFEMTTEIIEAAYREKCCASEYADTKEIEVKIIRAALLRCPRPVEKPEEVKKVPSEVVNSSVVCVEDSVLSMEMAPDSSPMTDEEKEEEWERRISVAAYGIQAALGPTKAQHVQDEKFDAEARSLEKGKKWQTRLILALGLVLYFLIGSLTLVAMCRVPRQIMLIPLIVATGIILLSHLKVLQFLSKYSEKINEAHNMASDSLSFAALYVVGIFTTCGLAVLFNSLLK